jgi:nucleolar protein 12
MRLAHLPKDERKEAKFSDPNRVARRLVKKKAKTVLANRSVIEKVWERLHEEKRDTER